MPCVLQPLSISHCLPLPLGSTRKQTPAPTSCPKPTASPKRPSNHSANAAKPNPAAKPAQPMAASRRPKPPAARHRPATKPTMGKPTPAQPHQESPATMNKAIIATVLLAACTAKQPALINVISCPAVPECVRPNIALATNADLVRAYQAADHAFQQCKIARDTLAACVKKESHVPND